MTRRQFLIQGGLVTTAVLAVPAWAQSAPVKIVVGFAAGGSTDQLARLLAESLREALGRPVIVENKPGAAGRLAVEAVKQSAANGETLLLAPHGPMTLFPHLYRSLRYHPETDFLPVTGIASSDYALAVPVAAGVTSVRAFRERAQAKGGATFGSAGAGTVLHFLGTRIGQGLGITMTHVAYKGAAPAVIDLAGGAIDATVTPLSDTLEMHRSGRVRVIATTGAERTTRLSGIPTMLEEGVDLDIPGWNALYAPAGLPVADATTLREAVHRVLAQPAVVQRMAAIGFTPKPMSTEALRALQHRESAVWAAAVKASGFTPEG